MAWGWGVAKGSRGSGKGSIKNGKTTTSIRKGTMGGGG